MKIKYLYIKNYKKFKDLELVFDTEKDNKLIKSIFNEMNVTALIGENGSGKTTILSFISIIFRYLQRKQSEIPSNFILRYQIDFNTIELSKKEENLFISINNEPKKLILEYDVKKGYIRRKNQKNIEIDDITYDDIMKYLPSKVVISSFDIDYPGGYNWNYKGHRLIEIVTGYAYQKESSIGLNISLGIFKFLKILYEGDNYLNELIKSLGLNLSDKVCAYCISETYDYDYLKNELIKILERYRYNNKEEIIDSIFKNTYLNQYFTESFGNLMPPYECFNLKRFLLEKEYNSEILELLIKEKLFYINDFYIKKGDFEYSMVKMSTGEKMFLGRIFYILSNIQENSIVIIEEPEVHLNYSWVKQIISVFIKIFGTYKCHFFISSHNYSFINNLLSEQILIMNDDTPFSPEFNTLLCNNEELNYHVFKKSNVKNYIEHYIQKTLLENNLDELKILFENLGESYVKVKMFKKLVELGEIYVED